MVNFDNMASQYAENRQRDPEVFRNICESSQVSNSTKVLDVGCGTGDYIIGLASAVACSCWGIDPSEGMLSEARQRSDRVEFLLGKGERLEFAENFFDLVFSVNAMHHMRSRPQYFREAYRVSKQSGLICSVTEAKLLHRRPSNNPLMTYFPETEAIALAEYPMIDELKMAMETMGFRCIREDVIQSANQVTDIKPYLEKSYSPLLRISDESFRIGIERMEQDLQKGTIDFTAEYSLLWGTK